MFDMQHAVWRGLSDDCPVLRGLPVEGRIWFEPSIAHPYGPVNKLHLNSKYLLSVSCVLCSKVAEKAVISLCDLKYL